VGSPGMLIVTQGQRNSATFRTTPTIHIMSTGRIALIAGVSAALALILGLMIGRASAPTEQSADAPTSVSTETTAPNATADQSSVEEHPATGSTPETEIPMYGTAEDRTAAVEAAENLGISGSLSDPTAMLAAADRVCYDFERLTAQGRSPFYATRVVWNESLAGLASVDLAGFATTFNVAVTYMCPEYADFAEEVAYILGI